jgi:hypothetical protein
MQRSTMGSRLLTIGAAVGALCVAGAAHAQVIVSDLVTQSGGLYQYDYTVTNTSSSDVFDIDITAPADPTAVQNPTAPAGYGISFDSTLGLVSLLEDTDPIFNPQFFGATPVSGFEYDSPFAPTAATFTAYSTDAFGNIIVLASGSVVPEPGALPLCAACTLTGTLLFRRRISRRTQR